MHLLHRHLFLISLLLALASGSARGLEPLRVVALTDARVFSAPLINEQGLTAFEFESPPRPRRIVADDSTAAAALVLDSTSQQGLYVESTLGVPELVAGVGQQAPGFDPGVLFSGFYYLGFNDDGDIAFMSSLTGLTTPTYNQALFSKQADEPLRLILHQGQTAPLPDSIGDTTIIVYSGQTPALGADGRVTTPVLLPQLGNMERVLQETPTGNLELLDNMVTVDTTITIAPRETAPTTLQVTATQMGYPNINVNGDAAHLAMLVPPADHGTGFNQHTAIVRLSADIGNRVVAEQGDAVPGVQASIAAFNRPAINSLGDVAFSASLDPGFLGYGAFRSTENGLSVIALSGDPAPGTGDDVSFDTLAPNVYLNDRGETLFSASLEGPEVLGLENTGLFLDHKVRGLSLVVREGDPAPGTQGDLTFRHLGTFYPTVNNTGQVAFTASLRNASSTSDRGIWAQDRQGQLHLIAREGDQLDVSAPGEPADLRTISGLNFLSETSSNHGPAYGTAFNDRGQVAFSARFTDGTYGVFVSNAVAVPEPMSAAMALGGLVLAAACRFKRRASYLSAGV